MPKFFELKAVIILFYKAGISRLHIMGKVNNLDQSVPHDLSDWDHQRSVEWLSLSYRTNKLRLGCTLWLLVIKTMYYTSTLGTKNPERMATQHGRY